MTFVSVFVYAFCQLLIPLAVGSFFGKVYSGRGRWVFYWLSGQILLWALFQLLTVPVILLNGYLKYVQLGMLVITVLLVLTRGIRFVSCKEWRRQNVPLRVLEGGETSQQEARRLLLGILAVVLLVIQLVMTVIYAYEEGDDAFYLALSTSTVDSGTMYRKVAYTGYTTGLDARHGLAPFPMWIALLCRLCGMHPTVMGQIVVPLVILLMAYGVHYLATVFLFPEDREGGLFFFVLVELLTLFGGYSTYSVENFLLVRASQGKAVLCALILPFLLVLYLYLFRWLRKERKIPVSYWILQGGGVLAGCLCSTQGGLLMGILIAIIGLFIMIVYRQWKCLIGLGISVIFPAAYLVLYVLL